MPHAFPFSELSSSDKTFGASLVYEYTRVCQLHTNELPLRHIIQEIDGRERGRYVKTSLSFSSFSFLSSRNPRLESDIQWDRLFYFSSLIFSKILRKHYHGFTIEYLHQVKSFLAWSTENHSDYMISLFLYKICLA